MKVLFLTFGLVGLIIGGGYYADAQFSRSNDARQLADSTPPWLSPGGGHWHDVPPSHATSGDPQNKKSDDTEGSSEPEPGSMEWLKIHYPEAYQAALRAAEKEKAEAEAEKAGASGGKLSYDRSLYQPALVLIEGDNGSGTGFICKIRDIPFLVTNIHVLGCADAADSYGDGLNELEAHTLDGNKLTLTGIYGAEEHDLCIIRFAEGGDYADKALEFETDVGGTVQVGDALVIPGNSKGGGTMVWTEGDVVGIGPTKIEHDAPVYEGNSGSPIIHIANGKVVGVLSYAEQVPIESFFDEEAFNDKRSAIKNDIRYFGYRLDSPHKWYGIELPRFSRQSEELDDFTRQRQNVAIFLYTDSDEWRTDVDLMQIVADANEQVRRKAIVNQIGRDSLNQISVTISRQLNGLIKNETYHAYNRYLRTLKAGGTPIQSYYPYFNETIEREVKIRDYLSRNIQDWEKRLRQ